MRKSLLLLIILFVCGAERSVSGAELPNQTFANNSAENCFEILQENVVEIGIFADGSETLQNLTYENLNFSRFYKTNSSLGIELDESLFEQRIYTFGEQTGLNNFQPFSPFTDGKMTEKFDENLKQFTIIENYLTDENGEKLFLDCGLIKADNEDLKNLKSENYGYDGDVNSLLKIGKKLNYKALLSQNKSFNYNDNIFMNWDKLFVFLKATGSDYFNFYNVVDEFPKTIKITSFDLDEDEYSGKNEYVVNPKNNLFSYYNFWQAIERNFPEFSKKLAFKGELHFGTLKRVLLTEDDGYFSDVWYIIMDSKGFLKYLKGKEIDEGMTEFYEYNMNLLEDMEAKIVEKLDEKGIVYDEKVDEIENIENGLLTIIDSDLRQNDTNQTRIGFYGMILLIIVGIIGLLAIFLENRKKIKKKKAIDEKAEEILKEL